MCKQKIPHSVKCLALKAKESMKIDTRGLDCIVKAKDNEIFIKATARGNIFAYERTRSSKIKFTSFNQLNHTFFRNKKIFSAFQLR